MALFSRPTKPVETPLAPDSIVSDQEVIGKVLGALLFGAGHEQSEPFEIVGSATRSPQNSAPVVTGAVTKETLDSIVQAVQGAAARMRDAVDRDKLKYPGSDLTLVIWGKVPGDPNPELRGKAQPDHGEANGRAQDGMTA